MNKLVSKQKKNIKSWVIDRLFSYSGGTYQRDRFPKQKFQLISDHIDISNIGSVLDVGCNEGFITNEFAKLGKFCVGIDVGPYFLNQYLNNLENVISAQSAAYGVFTLKDKNIDSIPSFDLILLLSVHHQLIYNYGDDHARMLVSDLINKSEKYLIIEFAAIASKYGFDEAPFIDNDEESIKAYAETWIGDLRLPISVEYLGKNKEHTEGNEREPFRFLFLINKNNE